MTVLPTRIASLFSSDSVDTETNEVDTKLVEREITQEVTRKQITLQFVRGGSETIQYDVFDGDLEDSSGIHQIRDGVVETTRNGVPVEQFCTITSANPQRVQGEGNQLRLYGSPTDEITTANVAHRRLDSETKMMVSVPVEELTEINTVSGETLSRKLPHRLGEATITELNNDN